MFRQNISPDRSYERRWWTLGVLSLSLLIIGLDNTILNVALPTLQTELTATATELQWMVDSYVLVFAGLLLTFGALGDRFGRAKALQAGLVIFGVASLGAAYSQSANQLIAARAIMGVGGAFIMPATLSILTDLFPREERGKAIAIWSGVAGAGIGLGPIIGGSLLEWFWWGSIFFANVPVVVIALVAGWVLVPDSRDPNTVRLDIPGAAFSLGAISTLIFAIIEAPSRGWTDGLVVAAFLVAIVLGGAFAWWEMRTSQPMLDFALFRNPRFSAGAGAVAVTFFALFGAIFTLTQYLQFVHLYTPLEAGAALIPMALGVMIGASNSNRLTTRWGTTRVVAGGILLVSLVLFTAAFWTVDTPYWIVGTTLFALALGLGNVMAPATDAIMGAVPEANAGVGSAMNDVIRQVAGALSIAIIGSVVNTVYQTRMDTDDFSLPPDAIGAVQDSLGAAVTIAARLPEQAATPLRDAAQAAFVDAFGIAYIVAAATALVGAILVARFMPAHHLPRAESETASHRPVAAESVRAD